MSYLPGVTDASSTQLICGAVPASAPVAVPPDPFEAWLSLMEVVEALCPEWPPREIVEGGDFRL